MIRKTSKGYALIGIGGRVVCRFKTLEEAENRERQVEILKELEAEELKRFFKNKEKK